MNDARFDKAVRLWLEAGEYKDGRPVLGKKARLERYREAAAAAPDGYAGLVEELTRRKLITWA